MVSNDLILPIEQSYIVSLAKTKP